jgi:hypothetical protein
MNHEINASSNRSLHSRPIDRCNGAVARPSWCAQTGAEQSRQDKIFTSDARFYVSEPVDDSMQQIPSLVENAQFRDARLIEAMESFPRAAWVYRSTSSEAGSVVAKTLEESREQEALPVFALYAVRGADCPDYPLVCITAYRRR